MTTKTKNLEPSGPMAFDIYQPVTVPLIIDLVRHNNNTEFTLTLSDKTITMMGCSLLLHLVWWQPLTKRQMPIVSTKHLFADEDFLNTTRVRIHTTIYNDLMAVYPEEREQILTELFTSVEDIYNIYVTELNEWHQSISLFDIAETMQNPRVAEVCNVDVSQEMKLGINAVEAKYKKAYARFHEVMTDPTTQPNAFYPFLKTGALNKDQFPQVLVACGTRTDVDETMISMPIKNSYLKGFGGIIPYAIDCLGAKKSIVYNAREMPNTQYANRKQQLLASVLRHIYPGDCGANTPIDFFIHPNFTKHVLGKNILDEGVWVELNELNVDHYKGKTVQLRSLLACRHTDGFCQQCGGGLTRFLHRHIHPGIAAAVELMAPLAQLVLSAKHLQKTQATVYDVPYELREYLTNINNELYLRDHLDVENLAICVPYQDIERIEQLKYVREGVMRNDRYFSNLTHLCFGNDHNKDRLTVSPLMVDKNKSRPFFKHEFLQMIRNHPNIVFHDHENNKVWISLRFWDKNKPLMGVIIINHSTKQFVSEIENLFAQKIKDYTSIEAALRDFSNKIWQKVTPNLMWLETMLRASMITSPSNYEIPVVTDPEAVMFSQLGKIIPRRALGTQFAFEQLTNFISSPEPFVVPRKEGEFDPFMCFSDELAELYN